MCKVNSHSFLVFGLTTFALAAAGAWTAAHAAVESPQQHATTAVIDQAASAANRNAMAACQKLPLSDRGICAEEAGYGQPVLRHLRSPAQQKVLDQENARYEAAVAACKHLPVSERTTCVSNAGIDTTLAAMK